MNDKNLNDEDFSRLMLKRLLIIIIMLVVFILGLFVEFSYLLNATAWLDYLIASFALIATIWILRHLGLKKWNKLPDSGNLW